MRLAYVSPKTISKGIFSWLLESNLDDESYEKIDPKKLRVLVDEQALTPTESRAVWCYTQAVGLLEEDLTNRVCQIQQSLHLDKDFESRARKVVRSALGKTPLGAPREFLSSPPGAFMNAIDALLCEEASNRPSSKALDALDARLFQHPQDRVLLNALKHIPLLDSLVGAEMDLAVRGQQLMFLSNAIRLSKTSMPKIYDGYLQAAHALGVSEENLPDVYISNGPINAYCIGADKPFINVSSSLVNLLNMDELRFVLGHELGHALCGHAKYHTLFFYLTEMGSGLVSTLTLGVSDAIINATIVPALSLWVRRSEYSADRAGMLACQNREAALRALMKISGFPFACYKEMRSRTLVEQAFEYDRAMRQSSLDRLYHVLNHLSLSHPLIVARGYELLQWLNDGEYDEIIESDEGRRAHLAALVEEDSQVHLFAREAILFLAEWAADHYEISRREASRTLRSMIYDQRRPQNSPLAGILRIEFEMSQQDKESVAMKLAVLVTEDGANAFCYTLEPPVPWIWNELPKDVKRELLASGSAHTIHRQLYSLECTQ